MYAMPMLDGQYFCDLTLRNPAPNCPPMSALRIAALFLLLIYLIKPLEADEAVPQRIVSLDLCTDMQLMLLVPRERILALSLDSFDPQYSPLARQALGFNSHSSRLEELVRLQPDLILASGKNAELAASMQALGLPVVDVGRAERLDEIPAHTRKLAALTGSEKSGEQLVSEFKRTLSVTRQRAAKSEPRVIVYAPNGSTPGKATLKNDVLEHLGVRNITARRGTEGLGHMDVEQVLRANPSLLIIDDATRNRNSLAQRFSSHPALDRLQDRIVSVHSGLWDCATPMVAPLLSKLTGHLEG